MGSSVRREDVREQAEDARWRELAGGLGTRLAFAVKVSGTRDRYSRTLAETRQYVGGRKACRRIVWVSR